MLDTTRDIVSLADSETKNKIRTLYLRGNSLESICKELKISKGTFDAYFWANKYGIRDFINDCKKERFLMLAENVSNEILQMETGKKASLLGIKQRETEFLRETLLKDHGYTKRVETIGLNLNKNEPLDDDQKAKLDKLIKVTGGESIKDAEVVESTAQQSHE